MNRDMLMYHLGVVERGLVAHEHRIKEMERAYRNIRRIAWKATLFGALAFIAILANLETASMSGVLRAILKSAL